jgi:uncharacterized protein YacL
MVNLPVDPTASAPSISARPDRKVIVAAVGGVVVSVIMSLLKHYLGDALPPETITLVTALVTAALAYVVPNTRQEVADRVTNPVIKLANADSANATTAKVVTSAESDQETAKDVASGVIPAAIIVKR